MRSPLLRIVCRFVLKWLLIFFRGGRLQPGRDLEEDLDQGPVQAPAPDHERPGVPRDRDRPAHGLGRALRHDPEREVGRPCLAHVRVAEAPVGLGLGPGEGGLPDELTAPAPERGRRLDHHLLELEEHLGAGGLEEAPAVRLVQHLDALTADLELDRRDLLQRVLEAAQVRVVHTGLEQAQVREWACRTGVVGEVDLVARGRDPKAHHDALYDRVRPQGNDDRPSESFDGGHSGPLVFLECASNTFATKTVATREDRIV